MLRACAAFATGVVEQFEPQVGPPDWCCVRQTTSSRTVQFCLQVAADFAAHPALLGNVAMLCPTCLFTRRAEGEEDIWLRRGAGVQIDDMPHIQNWMKRIEERAAVQKAMDIPEKSFVKQYQNDPQKKQEMIDGAKKFMGSQN